MSEKYVKCQDEQVTKESSTYFEADCCNLLTDGELLSDSSSKSLASRRRANASSISEDFDMVAMLLEPEIPSLLLLLFSSYNT